MRRLLLVGCTLLLLSGCVTVELGGSDSVPKCASGSQRGTDPFSSGVVLMAQAVPTASLLPCIDALPPGWTFARLEATDRGARFWLDSDRYGHHSVKIAVDRACDVQGATEAASEQSATKRFERVESVGSGYRAERYYTYTGGCIIYHFDLHGSAGKESVTAVAGGLGFVTRDTLRRMVHDYSDGRFELDRTTPAKSPGRMTGRQP